jgi:hypothetical protein
MKTIVKTFAIAALSALSLVATAKTIGPTKTKTFEVGMFQSTNTMKMNVLIEKTEGQKMTILLKNEGGEIIHREVVEKNAANYAGKFDLSQLADGKYTFEFSSGKETVTKVVNLSTNTKPVELNRNIALN